VLRSLPSISELRLCGSGGSFTKLSGLTKCCHTLTIFI